jgi:hypothetical protein
LLAAATDRRCGASVSRSAARRRARRKSSASFVLHRLFIFCRRKFRIPSDLMREIWPHLTGGPAAGDDQPLGGENLLPPLASCSRRASLFHVDGRAHQRPPPPPTRPPIPPPAHTRAHTGTIAVTPPLFQPPPRTATSAHDRPTPRIRPSSSRRSSTTTDISIANGGKKSPRISSSPSVRSRSGSK